MKNTFDISPNQYELSFQQKVVTPEAYYLLNDFCNTENQGKIEEQEKRRLSLGDVYKELEALDRPLLAKLKDYELNSVLSNDECLVIAVFLLSAKQIGPHAEVIESAIMRGGHEGDVKAEVEKISIPKHAKESILISITKLFDKMKNIE